jgi:hypothetical protein
MESLPELVTIRDVAGWLRQPVRRVSRLARQGRIPHLKLPGGDLLFEPAALRNWLARQTQPVEGGHAS